MSWRQHSSSEVTFKRDFSGVCSIRLTQLPTHDLKLDAGLYIQQSIHKYGMDAVPPAITPSLPAIFTEPLGSTLLTPAETHDFQVVTGGLLFLLSIRGNIALEVNFLCSRNYSLRPP